jgi:hypothetical protein
VLCAGACTALPAIALHCYDNGLARKEEIMDLLSALRGLLEKRSFPGIH